MNAQQWILGYGSKVKASSFYLEGRRGIYSSVVYFDTLHGDDTRRRGMSPGRRVYEAYRAHRRGHTSVSPAAVAVGQVMFVLLVIQLIQQYLSPILVRITVSILACQASVSQPIKIAGDLGSIPRQGAFFCFLFESSLGYPYILLACMRSRVVLRLRVLCIK
jgi:hypothetical protein